jgi:tRNA nucleotidyltransferase (CCA-adding enzyme)
LRTRFEDVLGALPLAVAPLVEVLVARAEEDRVPLYLVGGPVRDLLLGLPIRDVDLVVEPRARFGAAELVRAAAPRGARVEVHDRFETVRLTAGEASVDVATARSEQYRHPGALPKVEPGTLEQDLRRRDFSVNALALPLLRGRGPIEIVDPVGGLADLEARVLRILHERSFHDDPTRALRAARLSPRLDFHVSRGSLAALRDALRDGAFGAVSGDRLRRELEKLFEDATRDIDPTRALRLLSIWHVLGALEPGFGLPREAVAPVRRVARALASPPWRGPRFRPWVPGVAVWLAPLAAALRRRVVERLSIRGELGERLVSFPSLAAELVEPLARSRGRGAVDALLGEIDEEQLHALHAFLPTSARRRIVRWAAEDRGRRPPVSGSDLTAIGISGPAVGGALARIRTAFLDGAVANREEALALAREVARPGRARARTGRGRPAGGRKR